MTKNPSVNDSAENTPETEEQDADMVLQAIDELADRAKEIDELKTELEAANDQWKRTAAEFQNYRRRTEQEKAQMVTFGKSLVVGQLLDIVDDFQRSLEATDKAEAESEAELSPAYRSLKSGVELVYQKLMDELAKLGVEAIEAEGEVFDENMHEALMQQPAPDGVDEGTVLAVVQTGYRMGDRVLRHAKVVVAN
jgi:molecular chaperone GrpE